MFQIDMIRNGVYFRIAKVFGNLSNALAFSQEIISCNRGDPLSISILTSQGINPLVCSWHSENSKWVYNR